MTRAAAIVAGKTLDAFRRDVPVRLDYGRAAGLWISSSLELGRGEACKPEVRVLRRRDEVSEGSRTD
jgi:hypothetical protein